MHKDMFHVEVKNGSIFLLPPESTVFLLVFQSYRHLESFLSATEILMSS